MAEDKIVFLGRLEEDTGLTQFLKWLTGHPKYSTDFIGDGSLRGECEKYGKVHGFTNPKPFLKKAKICVPGGYLSYIEATQYGCKIMVFPNNPLKKDYWNEIEKEVSRAGAQNKFPTWNMIADAYLDLWKK